VMLRVVMLRVVIIGLMMRCRHFLFEFLELIEIHIIIFINELDQKYIQ